MRFSRFLAIPATLVLASILFLAACGSSSSTTTAGGSSTGPLTIGSKKDPDSQLQGEMYTLLLQKAGFTVTPKLALGDTNVLNNALQSGQIDLYPEFTGTGLNTLGLKGTSDPQSAYSQVKSGFESKYQITWLDAAFNLNDDYGLCTSQANATKYNLKKISDVTAVASQLVLTSQADAYTSPDVVPAMEKTYNLSFKSVVQLDESLSFGAVANGQADVNICYTTDPNIVTQKFVLLQDDKNAFPVYNPAPIVRDSILAKYPQIATILNPLAAKLTTDNIVTAIKAYSVDKQPIDVAATNLLKSLGLL